MEKLKLQLYDLLWRDKCCILHKNKNKDFVLELLPNRLYQNPYLLRCLIYSVKEQLKYYSFNCILSTDKKCAKINCILGYELGLPVYTSIHEIKEQTPLHIYFSVSTPIKPSKYKTLILFDMIPFKIQDYQSIYTSLYHIYDLLDFGNTHKFINELDWELTQINYYEKIPFEYRTIGKKDIQNRHIAVTKCYNLLFKKKSNLILDCSGLDAIRILKIIAEYGEYFFMVIVDTDCFATFTKKHRECFISCCKEKTLLIYDRLRIEKMNKLQVNKIVTKKIGKQDWLHGVFLYSFSQKILEFFKQDFPNLGIFFENERLETDKILYEHLQKQITQVIGIQLNERRQDLHIDSRIFYLKQKMDSLKTITNKSLTHSILFDNFDFLTLDAEQIVGCDRSLLQGIHNKSWSLFKNKF